MDPRIIGNLVHYPTSYGAMTCTPYDLAKVTDQVADVAVICEILFSPLI